MTEPTYKPVKCDGCNTAIPDAPLARYKGGRYCLLCQNDRLIDPAKHQEGLIQFGKEHGFHTRPADFYMSPAWKGRAIKEVGK